MNLNAAMEIFRDEVWREMDQALPDLPQATLEKLRKNLFPEAGRAAQFWEAANVLGNYYNEHTVSAEVRAACRQIIDRIREFMGRQARESKQTTTIVFGTSGWRGVIGEDFTVENVHKVIRGIIEMMKTDEFLKTNGYDSFDQVQKAGVLVLRDNRFMGEEFLNAAMQELAAEKIQIFNAGQCPTGVGSAILTELKAAGSINFTPSHNPMQYAGVKFNPADGGPADVNLTSLIEEHANAYMRPGVSFCASHVDFTPFVNETDSTKIFTDFIINKSKVFDLPALRRWLQANKEQIFILIDFMHGAARGYIEALLGDELLDELKTAGAVQFLNTNDDYSFHGIKPEPSAKNQRPLIEQLQQAKRPLTLAVALDPDADRIRFADAEMDIDMNRFGAIAYANLLDKGMSGGIASTAPSSDFALEIAKQNQQPVFETAVGFKYFREAMQSGQVLVAFEESDGISFIGHTLEKCALAGFLAALDIMASTNKNLSAVFRDLQSRYGYFYPDKAGADVPGVSVEAWQEYKKAVLQTLQHELFSIGDRVAIGDEIKEIAQINIIDGLKIIFSDKSWILLRPSGTEPKFRYYYELVSTQPVNDESARLDEYRQAAAEILARARALVDGKRR